MAGALGIDPSVSDLQPNQLTQMFESYLKYTWDHTVAIRNTWTKKPTNNPFRKRRKKRFMRPTELHALAKAIDNRNAKRDGHRN